MSGLVITAGDLVEFSPQFGHRTVTPSGPAVMTGSGKASIEGRRICVAGDETNLSVAATYAIAGHTAGTGTLEITGLGADQRALHARSGTPVLVEGSRFAARFTPTVVAQQISTGTPDPNTPGFASGRFVPAQKFVRAL